MADVFSIEKRSEIMRSVKSNKNKSTELKVINFFKDNHITGWRRNYKVKGHPDFVFPAQHIAVFVDGCFWHGHDCRNTKPSSNSQYWDIKLNKNIERDKMVTAMFEKRGWLVIRVWECELKKKNLNQLRDKMKPLLSQE